MEDQGFFDRALPTTIKFLPDCYHCGDIYGSAWAIREYPPSTEEQALFARLAERAGVTLRAYNRAVELPDQRKMLQNTTRRNRVAARASDAQESINAEENLQDIASLLANMRRNREPLLYATVFIELRAGSLEDLRNLQQDVAMELGRSKVTADKLTLRQKEGFLSALPAGANQFGATQFERPLPASSVANLYPFSYSGKNDSQGFYLGRDAFGTNILVDFSRRAPDKTNANVLILGNSGEGKSFLMKLILANLRESGKAVIALDVEAEYGDLTRSLGGCYVDFMSGEYMVNPLEPKSWSEQAVPAPNSRAGMDNGYGFDAHGVPEAFRKTTRLSQHIAYLKDFFRAYKDFTDAQIDTIEILLEKLYANFRITDQTDFSRLAPEDYPIMEDFYALAEQEFQGFNPQGKQLYTGEILQEICLGLHSMCRGAESKFFNGHTNVTDGGLPNAPGERLSQARLSGSFLCFGVKGLMDTNQRLRDTLLFNLLSFMSNELLGRGNTVAAIDELYMYLNNKTAVEYIRNAMKRVRKKESAMILASQNISDFLIPGVKEYTKPLFSIPTHQFLFFPGNIDARDFTDTLQLEQAEYELIRHPKNAHCLFKCGNERYYLRVIAPAHKRALFGEAGGR